MRYRVREVHPYVWMPDYGPLLTKTELAMLQCAADGMDYKQTAAALWFSTHYVKWVLKRINRRLCARNKTHAVAIAWRAGLLS